MESRGNSRSELRRIVRHGDVSGLAENGQIVRSNCMILAPIRDLVGSTGFTVLDRKDCLVLSYLYFDVTIDAFRGLPIKMHATGRDPAVNVQGMFEKLNCSSPTETLLNDFRMQLQPMFELDRIFESQNAIFAQPVTYSCPS